MYTTEEEEPSAFEKEFGVGRALGLDSPNSLRDILEVEAYFREVNENN